MFLFRAPLPLVSIPIGSIALDLSVNRSLDRLRKSESISHVECVFVTMAGTLKAAQQIPAQRLRQ